MERSIRVGLALVLLLLAAPAGAHDYWVAADSFSPAQGKDVPIRLFVGTKGAVKEHPYKKKFAVRFAVLGPSGESQLGGKDYYRPAGTFNAITDGIYTVIFESRHAFIELAAAKFEAYLIHEGLEPIIAERKKLGEAQVSGKESYMRNAKALIRVGDGGSGWNRKAGLPCEITALDNPFRAKKGARMRFVVELFGKPLADTSVELIKIPELDIVATGKTDRSGTVRFAAPGAGQFMVAATHMRRASAQVRGDWESLWSTLTFER